MLAHQYHTLAELATHTETLLKEPISEACNHEAALTNSNGYYNVDQDHSGEDFSSKQDLCRDLEKRGLLRLLTSGKPMELGFSMLHRHVLPPTERGEILL